MVPGQDHLHGGYGNDGSHTIYYWSSAMTWAGTGASDVIMWNSDRTRHAARREFFIGIELNQDLKRYHWQTHCGRIYKERD